MPNLSTEEAAKVEPTGKSEIKSRNALLIVDQRSFSVSKMRRYLGGGEGKEYSNLNEMDEFLPDNYLSIMCRTYLISC